ncbi:IclR family transcriptional regulator [Devosia beringensis]|uniref:IclR family transcriptional regulator n=1 Tax=Devosia beringensis TaxID=2657486 RepID=UPI00186B7F4A|nr:IclR family transcriptional regulator [Devosia beringensis]
MASPATLDTAPPRLAGDAEKAAKSRDLVQSVERAMALLEALAEDGSGLRLTDLVQKTGLSPSTAHRLLTTLQTRQFVHFDPVNALWFVGRQTFSVGLAYGQRQSVLAPALPLLRPLRDLTRETANIGIVDDGAIVLMGQIESREIVRAIGRTGGRAPLFGSAMGKAILSTYRDEDVHALLKQAGLPRTTSAGPGGTEALLEELALVRERGYAVDEHEFSQGLRCVASPVRDRRNEAIAAVSVSGLAARLTLERLPVVGAQVVDVALRLSQSLAGRER